MVVIPKHRKKCKVLGYMGVLWVSEETGLTKQNTKFLENTRDPRIERCPAHETPSPREPGNTPSLLSPTMTAVLHTQYPRRLFKGSKIEVSLFALGANMFVEAMRTGLGTHFRRSCWPPAPRPGHQERGKISQVLVCTFFQHFLFSLKQLGVLPVKDSLGKETQESIHLLNMSVFREAYKTCVWTVEFNFKQMSKI